jgi:ATP-dependent DNA helicase RecQ
MMQKAQTTTHATPPIQSQEELLPTLQKFFGFNSFRPLQEEIIREVLDGRDALAVLPTGGGKSLCFQLPALIKPGLTVVISPLIALMKDQVDALQAMGIAATCLNSSIDIDEFSARTTGLHTGDFRLLYVAPERLMTANFIASLRNWNVNLLAVDEAHCISEWGHDFRPEYRDLAKLRGIFPNVPMLALTATATVRVQSDIVTALKLCEPKRFIASFNRPNLSYRVVPKKDSLTQITEFIKARKNESGIVYCQSRKSTEGVAADLRAEGIKAQPYHAGMDGEDRSKNQELFLRDEVNVICATIAFGMGINKPNVRFVIHYDLPKNIEGYYQETGRAGRDGLAADCVLLFSAGDAVKQQRFIDDKENEHERQIANNQLRQMLRYAECTTCRRGALLGYFGETYPNQNCGNCDNCISPRDQYDGTIDAQKFLSCLYRLRERSTQFGAGLKYVCEILTGADNDIIKRWNHETLSTFGIGKEHSVPEWQAIGRQLIHMGYVKETMDGKYTRIDLSIEGKNALTQRKKIFLAKPAKHETEGKAKGGTKARALRGEIECDEVLFERLRQVRKRLADERGVPPYIVFSDVALRQMARDYPIDDNGFSRISGVGEKKRAEFGAAFVGEIKDYLKAHPPKKFAALPKPSAQPRTRINGTTYDTLQRFRSGMSVEAIAKQRGLTLETIYGHLSTAIEGGETLNMNQLLTPEQQAAIDLTFSKIGMGNLTGVMDLLGGPDGPISYGQLRVYRTSKQRTRDT